jgi:hypothetical protein
MRPLNLSPHHDGRRRPGCAQPPALGGLRSDRDALQFDCALSYGPLGYLRTIEALKEHRWSWRRAVLHGGHQMSLNIAAGPGLGGNESYAGIFAPFGGFADDFPVEDGYARFPDAPDVGFETKQELNQLMRSVAE